MKVVIVDYNMGNIKSVQSVLRFVGVNDMVVSSSKEDILSADKIILPGVGAFNQAMQHIKERHLDSYLTEAARQYKKSILGICLGMQILSESSNENGEHAGLGLIPAQVSRFDQHVKIPHVGFNQVNVNHALKLYKGMSGALDFYFTHSYRMHTKENINQCLCQYEDDTFIASYEMDNIAGVQFHPELSQTNGIKLIKNFIEQF